MIDISKLQEIYATVLNEVDAFNDTGSYKNYIAARKGLQALKAEAQAQRLLLVAEFGASKKAAKTPSNAEVIEDEDAEEPSSDEGDGTSDEPAFEPEE